MPLDGAATGSWSPWADEPHDEETTMKFKALGLAAAAVAMYAIPAFAHHSFAMFDADKKVTLEGTVKEFQWTNPHSWILMTRWQRPMGHRNGRPGRLGSPRLGP